LHLPICLTAEPAIYISAANVYLVCHIIFVQANEFMLLMDEQRKASYVNNIPTYSSAYVYQVLKRLD